MKSISTICMILGLALLLMSCSSERGVAPGPDSVATESTTLTGATEQVARDIVRASGWELDPDGDLPAKHQHPAVEPTALPVFGYEREAISDDIVHYSWRVRVGRGPFDVVGIHRVVKERSPYKPVRARESVFMLHGDFKDFTGCFLPGLRSSHYPDDFGIAAYLAEEGVDVWGMDQAHNSIPAGATNFASMADWDMNKYVHDTRTGLAVARLVRLLTGNGFRKMDLLGFSGGGSLALAVATKETMLPRGLRHVEGLIPVDQGFFATDEWAAGDCEASQYYADLINSGEYVEENPFPLFGEAAQLDPDGDSELVPGFTNLQAALAIAVYPYAEGFPHHFLAGSFDADGVPTGLQYTNVDLWIDFLVEAPPYFANAFSRDEYIAACGAEYAPWSQQLGDVELPVLFVSAAGGFGGLYGPTLAAMVSADVTQLTVELHPAEEVDLDFAHIDLFTADNAPQLVWQPIKEWVACRTAFAVEAYPQLAENSK